MPFTSSLKRVISTSAVFHSNSANQFFHKAFCISVVMVLLLVLCPVTASIAEESNQIIVISDLHLGADDAFSEIRVNKDILTEFLLQIRNMNTVSELVIAGDLMDEWFLPMNFQMPATIAALHDSIVENNQPIIDAINGIIQDGRILVTYIPGNHDMLFDESETQRIFPDIHQARDAAGLGAYRQGSIVVEHGHRYSITCAPDPLSNVSITGGGSLLPSGYFLTRLAASSISEGITESAQVLPDISPEAKNELQLDYYTYYMGWKMLLTMLPIQESFSEKAIQMGIDGYTDSYAVNDFVPQLDAEGNFSSLLYNHLVENWMLRQEINLVASPIAAHDAILGAAFLPYTDTQAKSQYFDLDPSVKVVVFGHSHIAEVQTIQNMSGDTVICANSGTWIDHPANGLSCTYIVVTPKEDETQYSVALYQYTAGGESILLTEAKTNP